MARLTLQLRTLPRGEDHEDSVWCETLVGWVTRAVASGRAAPAAVVRRPGRVDLLALGPVQKAKVHMPGFLACLTRSELPEAGSPDALAIVGVVRTGRRGGDPAVPMAVVFVEWPDNRWWFWRALLTSDGQIREDTIERRSAVEGDPLPNHFGRWWSHGRRNRLTMRLAPAEPPPMVH